MGIKAILGRQQAVGELRIFATDRNNRPNEITFHRGYPVQIQNMSYSDPFGAENLSLAVPGVTRYERMGGGDIFWLGQDRPVDVYWFGNPYIHEHIWAGTTMSVNWTGDIGVTLDCRGAMYQLDDYLAKPRYLPNPITYENAIAATFLNHPGLRLKPLRVDWPDWWQKVYAASDRTDLKWYQYPADLALGQRWTGMLTRETGGWEPALTSYIQTLLSSMHSERGQWTLALDPFRVPVLRHRDMTCEDPHAVTVNAVQPGISVEVSEDWSQSATAVYGQGVSLAGVSYTGLRLAATSGRTYYEPLVAYDPDRIGVAPREVMVQVQEGLTEVGAKIVAANQLRRFASPGLVGTITLESDPLRDGLPYSRFAIRPSDRILVKGLLGIAQGVLFHISNVSLSFTDQKVTLTVDTKYRDQLTIEEVMLRTRDSLSITRALVTGKYSSPVPDMLFPWSDEGGSGVVPIGAREFFEDIPPDAQWPWEQYTKARPPKAFERFYAKIGPKDANASNNWSVVTGPDGMRFGYPVLLSQSGTISTVQLAAYDEDGNVKKVRFHFSLWWTNATNETATPMLEPEPAPPPVYPPGAATYPTGQHYPFFQNAWQSFNEDGTQMSSQIPVAFEQAGLIIAIGSYGQRAGYFPGNEGVAGSQVTGLLSDQSEFNFDTQNPNFDPYWDTNRQDPVLATAIALFYCDEQGTAANNSVYFLGRMARKPPGSSV